MEDAGLRARVEAEILSLAEARGLERTFCPSEAARRVAEDWRPLMPLVREVAAALWSRGRLAILKGGVEITPEEMRGAIRLKAPKGPVTHRGN